MRRGPGAGRGRRRRRKDAEAHFAASALVESGSVGLSLTREETKACSEHHWEQGPFPSHTARNGGGTRTRSLRAPDFAADECVTTGPMLELEESWRSAGGANRQPGLLCLGLPSKPGLPNPEGSSEPITGQRHPQPCCRPALFMNNLHGTQPASTSLPSKGKLAALGCQDPPAPVVCTWGYFRSFQASLAAIQLSMAVKGTVSPLHPHLLPVTQGGRSQPALGKRRMGSRRGVPTHTQGTGKVPALMAAAAQSHCQEGRGCHRSPPAMGAPVAPQETWSWGLAPS